MPYLQWQIMAGREGGMTLWHFNCALTAIKSSLDSSAGLRAIIGVREVEDGLIRLREVAPDLKALRNSIGHRFELMKTPSAISANATKPFEFGGVKIQSSGGFFTENFCGNDGNTFVTTAHTHEQKDKGKTVKYDLSQETLDELTEISQSIYSTCRGNRSKS